MKSSPKLRPNGWDALVALAVAACAVALAAAFWGGGTSDSLTAVIAQDGKTIETVALSSIPEGQTETVTVGGAYTAAVELERGRVRIARSDCPTQDCVHTGWISRPGQSIVCLPNRLTVELTGGDGGVDAVLG